MDTIILVSHKDVCLDHNYLLFCLMTPSYIYLWNQFK